jgi:ribonucleases P/MRP protein subunit RPP40
VFTTENFTNMPVASRRAGMDNLTSLSNIDITQDKIIRIVEKLQENKAAGVDGLNSTFIKSVIHSLAPPLVILFKESLATGVVPQDWKMANVTAIFKKGSKKDPGNYRPVSLTSQICKIMERVIKDEITNYLESNKLIYNSQHGFRKNRSCLTNLLEFMETVASRLDRGEPLDIIYLDFQKAFDKVPFSRLILKLEAMGINGNLLDWIRGWLSERKQRVVLNGYMSEWEKVFSGVPQGSVLGPILFTIFINDLDEDIINKILKFADDTKLIGSVQSQQDVESLRRDLEKLTLWSEQWQMGFNVDKCKIMHLGGKNSNAKYSMGGRELKVVTEEKDLGVVVCSTFKVANQCATAARKGYQTLGLISRTFISKKKCIISMLYKSLVRPHLDYCIQAWRPHLQKDIDVLERVQRRATKMVEECKGMDYEERLRFMKLTTLEVRRERADLIEVYKILNGLEGLREEDFFVRHSNVVTGGMPSRTNTRGNSLKLYKKGVKLDVAKYSFGNRVVNSWNKLPDTVVKAETVNAFKGRLDDFLLHTRGSL